MSEQNTPITSVDLHLSTKGIQLAWGSVTVCGKMKVKISILKSSKGEAFVGWPQEKYTDKDGAVQYKKHVEFIDQETGNDINNFILKSFNKLLSSDPVDSTKHITTSSDESVPAAKKTTKKSGVGWPAGKKKTTEE